MHALLLALLLLQDVCGELAAGGVCAAVALTYEATLPRLDEALARAQVALPYCSTT
jgi:hypothetical protein